MSNDPKSTPFKEQEIAKAADLMKLSVSDVLPYLRKTMSARTTTNILSLDGAAQIVKIIYETYGHDNENRRA